MKTDPSARAKPTGTLETRLVRAPELRLVEDGGKKVMRGYSAVYEQKSDLLGGWFIEIIRTGAFRNVLARKPDVRCLFNHDPNMVLGRTAAGTLRLIEDVRGLAMECDPPDTQVGRDVSASIARGDVSQQSFSFIVAEDRWTFSRDPDVPTLREIIDIGELYDVGPVTFPAYPGTDVRSREGAENVFKAALRAHEDQLGADRMRMYRLRMAELESP